LFSTWTVKTVAWPVLPLAGVENPIIGVAFATVNVIAVPVDAL
jgi:hypothetical protein